MFAQVCLVILGVRYGRKLLREALEAPPPTPKPAEERAAAEERAVAEREEILRQFDLSLVCMGLTSVATLFAPQLRALSGVAVLYSGLPIMRRAREMLIDERRVGAEVLDTAGMLSTLSTHHVVSSAFMFFLYAGSRRLRLLTEAVMQEGMVTAFERHAEFAWVERGGVEVHVPIAALQIGEIVVVDAGGVIPIDGVVVRGFALVDQRALTGEAQPLERGAGDRVFAATIVCSGRLHVRVETTGRATVAAELADMLARTADFTEHLESQGQRIADRMALPTLTLSAMALPAVGPAGAAALMSSSFLDSMRLFIPLSMLRYLRDATEAGALIRDGRSLSALARVDTIVFDKTGTLTLDRLSVGRIWPCEGRSEDEVVRLAAAAERRQSHPIARAIVDAAERRGLDVPAVGEGALELGFGVSVVHEGRPIRVGSRRFMASQGVELRSAPGDGEGERGLKVCSRVYVAHGEALVGVLEVEPTVHPKAAEIVERLRARGLALHLVSGDHEAPTQALARSLGLDHFVAAALPADKARIVADLASQGRRVCFVGDGINDCLALARAEVSVSLVGSAPSAVDSAQVVLPDLASLTWLFELADRHRRDVARLGLALGVPSALGIAGVLLARFGVPAMTALYGASVAAGVAVTMWPRPLPEPPNASTDLRGDTSALVVPIP